MEALRAIRRPIEDSGDDDVALLHNSVYDELRWRMITGRIVPGIGLSTRGLAQELGVSQMPVREALSRLAAEGAIEIRSKRRITVPAMTPERFDDLLRCRLLLEPEAARDALDAIDRARLKRLKEIDARIDAALKSGDPSAYMEGNYSFHFELYRARHRPTLHRLIETLWLQFGPFMRVVYGRFGTAGLVDQHAEAIKSIEAGDREALGRAIHLDIEDGMGLIGRHGLE
ncbi:MAG TPA: GntR family transcriptional regulator [Stellaceae bacterium]|nr:GntR family transcriptional regulator [Stellaceae bacterium]